MLMQIAASAKTKGWRALLVGGAVRDMVLGIEPKDLDIEVYGPNSAEELHDFLQQFGEVNTVGRSFGVFKINNEIDVSLPRRESKSGNGHKGFVVEGDGHLSISEAASRRAFTINSMAFDPLKNETIDIHNGRKDLENKVLSATSRHFVEDPLRVLRGMQFCGRFGLTADPMTVKLCRSIYKEHDTPSMDRVWEEWWKWATKSTVPSKGMEFLWDTNWVCSTTGTFILMRATDQDPKWHPEGNVWDHTMIAIDQAAKFDLPDREKAIVMFATLLHDIGKVTTTTHDDDGFIRSKGHAQAGEAPAREFLETIGAPEHIIEPVLRIIVHHLDAVSVGNAERQARRLAVNLAPATIQQWALVVEADNSARPPLPKGLPEQAARIVMAAIKQDVESQKPKPILMGRHLIEVFGMEPGPAFKAILDRAFEAQLDGFFCTLPGAIDWMRRKSGF